MFDLAAIQAAIREQQLDGWLLYDFRRLNVLACRVLGFGESFLSRRWFYFIPAQGEPQKLVHRIESASLDRYPGGKTVYLKWQELEAGVGKLVQGAKKIAMEYVPRNSNPYVSRVDAGTIELVRSFGVDIVSSGDLVQTFEAVWDDEQWALHLEAATHTDTAYDAAFGFIRDRIQAGRAIRETDVQRVILEHFDLNGLVADHAPNVSVGPHSGDPHYEPKAGSDSPIHEGDFVLIDLWAKCKKPRAVYSDLTRTAFVGSVVPGQIRQIFSIVAAARDAAIAKVREAFAANKPLFGWEVDQAARDVIEKAGHGPAFCHRTGHSIGQEVHGNGANMDGLETREDRRVLRQTCFSIEPGIYYDDFGVRSEVDVFIDKHGEVHVTGGPLQTEVFALLR
ncbi:MAG: M24 family metallopeptidase [Gemmataceae bacterium]|nr:M24 family metallopeptidase [Gemmataceae bacterium]